MKRRLHPLNITLQPRRDVEPRSHIVRVWSADEVGVIDMSGHSELRRYLLGASSDATPLMKRDRG